MNDANLRRYGPYMDLELPPPRIDLPENEIQQRFDALQKRLAPLWRSIATVHNQDEQTIVVVPSLSVDIQLFGAEAQAYEERFLFLLLLLRQPGARLHQIVDGSGSKI